MDVILGFNPISMMDKLTIYDKAQEDLREVDIYRDTPIRFLGMFYNIDISSLYWIGCLRYVVGYANEIGEAFRAWVPTNAVRLSYVVSMGYVFSDTANKSRKTYQLNYLNSKERSRAVALRAIDTLIWQSMASVIIPGFMINRVCYLSTKLLSWSTKWPLKIQKLTSTILGLCIIPFIVKPIDTAVEIGMQSSVRKFYPTGVFEK
ncbi:unnamed protein product [Acanthocheilonema viteae]|uniref:Mitochondrial fission process protein 1 n=1 Tax=Acanthocheilonema viteae TaxID=6277 RepID=A0A498SQK9_ACAVI|nr:unnamed protein product [Acanthocheilonema viteae]